MDSMLSESFLLIKNKKVPFFPDSGLCAMVLCLFLIIECTLWKPNCRVIVSLVIWISSMMWDMGEGSLKGECERVGEMTNLVVKEVSCIWWLRNKDCQVSMSDETVSLM